jgi:hypothetical protein
VVDKFPVHEDFKRLLSFVNQEMDRNIRDYKTVFPHLFTKVFERVVPVSSFGDVSGTTMKSEHSKSVKDVIQSKAQSPKPIQSSKSMGRGCGSMRDNARKGYTPRLTRDTVPPSSPFQVSSMTTMAMLWHLVMKLPRYFVAWVLR